MGIIGLGKVNSIQNPPEGRVNIGIKSDDILYLRNSDGVETPLSEQGTQGTQGSQGVQGPAGSASGSSLNGTNYLFVAADGDSVENATALKDAYDEAKTMNPSSNNIITIIAAPGYYDFTGEYFYDAELDAEIFKMDTSYINLVSLDGNRSIIFSRSSATGQIQLDGSISITANNIYVKGVDVLAKKFDIESVNSTGIKIEKCSGGRRSFGDNLDFLNAEFINCLSIGSESFGYQCFIIESSFIDCESTGINSFGYQCIEFTGLFKNCKAGSFSFCSLSFIVLGSFIDCEAGTSSFLHEFGSEINGDTGESSATFVRCKGDNVSFFAESSLADNNSTLIDCEGANSCFSNCNFNGLVVNFIGGDNCFGIETGQGRYINCLTGNNSFSYTLEGEYINCISGNNSFQNIGQNGVLHNCVSGNNSFQSVEGKVNFCRTTGTFGNALGDGAIIASIDSTGFVELIQE